MALSNTQQSSKMCKALMRGCFQCVSEISNYPSSSGCSWSRIATRGQLLLEVATVRISGVDPFLALDHFEMKYWIGISLDSISLQGNNASFGEWRLESFFDIDDHLSFVLFASASGSDFPPFLLPATFRDVASPA